MWKYALTGHFAHFKDFVVAARKKDGLPNYSFIEPIYFDSIVWGPENDMHPECNPYTFYGAANLHRGEALVAEIYDAIRNGPNWESTLFLILFDEHGGCYDHVIPPSAANSAVAINPDGGVLGNDQHGGAGFKFDRLGPRVPAIIVSAYTPPQTRLHQIFEHTSILGTVVNCFDLPPGKLGERQVKALSLSAALQAQNPRQDVAPIAKPHFSILEDMSQEWHSVIHSKFFGTKPNPITDLQKAALNGAALFIAAHTGDRSIHDRAANVCTELEADIFRAEQELKLFKNKIR